ncbi:hypothetical protein [Streptomyces sp. CRN 30]|uniref:hypothetical protein n=1 Tax=Streptomyces sp. CRN 30 TaxID=3075613 RepID=UPI002A80D181|nr:hypothetical protein [Streptomyces sp. CRN 30]
METADGAIAPRDVDRVQRLVLDHLATSRGAALDHRAHHTPPDDGPEHRPGE